MGERKVGREKGKINQAIKNTHTYTSRGAEDGRGRGQLILIEKPGKASLRR